jgi:hypothetical protein
MDLTIEVHHLMNNKEVLTGCGLRRVNNQEIQWYRISMVAME